MEKQYYISKEQFIALKEAWKKIANPTASDMIIYNILRSKAADNGFSPKTKNIQGIDEWRGYNDARYSADRFISMRRVYGKLPGATYSGYMDAPGKAEEEFKARFGIEMPKDLKNKIQEAKK